MPITTVAVTASAARPDGSLIAGGKFRFLLSAADTENGLIVPKEITATANSSGVAVANLWPNSLGAAGTQYRVLLSDPAGGTLDLGSCTVPTSACNLHAILGLGAAPTLDQATVAKLAAQTAAAASSASATQSATSATSAAASATAAAGSATAAQTSATSAAGSVSAVATSATNAANSATAAGNSATSAAASNTAAGTSATNAASSATAAATSATSASTSASDALASKNAAATSATNSSNSATNSANSATNSANSATGAATSATAALASQNAAATSATNASTSAATASTQAGIATTQATNAATSAASAASNAAAVAAATTGNMSAQNANAVAITGGSVGGTSITVKDNVFTLQDDGDTTKQAQFQLSSISTGVTRTYTLPNGDGVLATLNGTQTWNAPNTFSSSIINVGSAVIASTQQFAYGATTTGLTKTVNVGTGGLSGSTTAITVGSANGSTTTMLGTTIIGGAAGSQSLQVNSVASAVNYLQAVGAVTTGAPLLSVQGTDSNISLPIISKGTGAIDLAAGSSGVNISNGGTVTALTRINGGSGYTSKPTINISAPTTAGGVQATASTDMFNSGGTIQAGGTGYTNGDVLTVVGGTLSPGYSAAKLTVTGISAGVVTSVSANNFASYNVLPTNPVSVTGGTGSGVTVNLTYGIQGGTTFLISNAGSGYVEQPTVTFSGGGGTGASAYATIGSGTAIKSLGSTLSFNTPGGTQLRISDTNSVNYLQLTGAATGAAPTISAQGSDAVIGLTLSTKSTGRVLIPSAATVGNASNGASQFAVSLGTGFSPGSAWTTNSATFGGIQATGSSAAGAVGIAFDTTNGGWIACVAPGQGYYNLRFDAQLHDFVTTGTRQFRVQNTGSAVNYIQATGATTGNAPTLSAQGSDTNVSLVLQSQGTGVVALGGTTTANSGFVVAPVASSVNYIQAAGVATGGNPLLSTQGTNTDITLRIQNKGTLSYYGAQFENSTGGVNFQICSRASSVNYFRSNPATTGNAPELSVQGSDTNINLKLVPQGTGTVQYGTYTAGALSPTGYITITDAAGTSRRLLVG